MAAKRLAVTLNGKNFDVVIDEVSEGNYNLTIDGIAYEATAEEIPFDESNGPSESETLTPVSDDDPELLNG